MRMRFAVILLLCCIAQPASAQSPEERATQFLGMLLREQYDSCHQTFDSTLASKVSAEMLNRIGSQFSQYLGDYQGSEAPKTEKKEAFDVVQIRLKYEKSSVRLSLSYTAEGKVAGIYFLPGASENSYQLPSYARLGSYTEKKLLVKSGAYQLPAVLTLPNLVESPPVALLLAGSGPNDKDESIGPNKVLKDIALGLASMGVASLRYDKRTLVYGAELKSSVLGIEEEVIDDALSAIKLIRAQEETRSSGLFVVGHSLGGMCAPLLAKRAPKVKAVLMLAANARPLEDVLYDQVEYIYALDSLEANEKADLTKLKRQIARVKDPSVLKSAPSDSLPLGLPAAYWQSLNRYNQLSTAQKLSCPVVILQGKRDYQVTMKDFELWKSTLQDSDKNRFFLFDELNHLFMPGEGKSSPEEYQKLAHVNLEVIRQLADYIKSVQN